MAGGNGRPNVVLIVLDTLTADAAGLGRAPARMPALESMAERGMVFTHAVANAPWTYPSHASLFTGLLPSGHRMENPRQGLAWGRDLGRLPEWIGPGRGPKNDPALADRWLPAVLRRAGYETTIASNNPWVGRLMGMDYGFDNVRDTLGVGFMPTRGLRRVPRGLRSYAQAALLTYRAMRGQSDMLARDAVDWAAKWVSRRNRSRPFFLLLNLMEAHYPYLTPAAPRALRAALAGPVGTFRAMRMLRMTQLVSFNLDGGSAQERRALGLLRMLHQYAATYLDDLVRELSEMAEREGRGMIFCVTSDHGEEFGERDAVAHMFTLNEPALHIPLVLSGRGVPAGEQSATVELRQIYSTLLATAGVGIPEGSAPSLLDQPLRDVVVERDRIETPPWASTEGDRARERTGRLRAVYRDPWKLVSTCLGSRLFDLSSDPSETYDLAGSHPELAGSMEAALADWPDHLSEEVSQRDRTGMVARTGFTEREEAEIQDQLAALGYLE